MSKIKDPNYDLAQAANLAVFNAIKSVAVANRNVPADILIPTITDGAAHGLAAFAYQMVDDPESLREIFGDIFDQALAQIIKDARSGVIDV